MISRGNPQGHDPPAHLDPIRLGGSSTSHDEVSWAGRYRGQHERTIRPEILQGGDGMGWTRGDVGWAATGRAVVRWESGLR